MDRRTFLRNGITFVGGAFVLAALPASLVGLMAEAAHADGFADYPEFPYPPTDYTEALRGQFHFSSRWGWMNDPNGLLYHDGLYHFCYQHNPHGLAWDTMHWGHATSPDLVHWTQKPVALEPGVHPGDLWSGGGVVDTNNTSGLGSADNPPLVVFTGTNGVTVNYSTDGARTFQSYANGRQVAVPAGTSRDPKVTWDAARGRWVMVVWSDGGGNGANFYTSPDLLNWTFASRYTSDWVFECPDFFTLPVDGDQNNQKWVLTDAAGNYVIGSFDGTTFSPDWSGPQRMDQGADSSGGTFYAGQTFSATPDGRTVQMVWQPGNHGSVWTGNASFPAVLGLATTPAGIRITRNPVDEISLLRTDTTTWSNVTVGPDSDPFAGIDADTYEIIAEFDTATATATQFGFLLHCRSDGTYDKSVGYDMANQTLYGAPLSPDGGRVQMHILVDRGQLEIFGNNGVLSYTDNVNFDSSAGSLGLRAFATGGSVRLVSARFHRIGSAWGQGESTLESTLSGPWRAIGGAWIDTAAGKQGTASGDTFYLSDTTAGDFTYDGDVRLDSAQAVALTFRASADGSQHYTANVDDTGVVKLWRPGHDIAAVSAPITTGRTYHLRVVAGGSRIQVYLDHATTPVIDATDSTYSSGYLGVNVFNGSAAVQNLTMDHTDFTTNLAGPWTPVAGTWTTTTVRSGVHGNGAGDNFYLSGTTAANFTYQGDVTAVNGGAAALTFRASADASQHYTANVDTTGLVKLWRPGSDLGTYATEIVSGRAYHLTVVADGTRIQVYLNNGATPVIDVTDSAYSSGYLGANVFNGSGVVQNLMLS